MTRSSLTKGGLKLPLLLFVATIISRLPFTGKMLYHMDSVQYALALDHYDISLHQPHPPGYFVYILLGRLMHRIIDDPNQALIALSIMFTAGTVVVVYLLTKEMFDGRIALLAAMFALTSPNLWFHGEIAMNYGLESFFSVVIAYACWKVHVHKNERTLLLLAVLLSLSGGIRQNTPVFLLPLVLYACKDIPKRSLLLGALTFVASSSAWFVPMIRETGGWSAYAGAFSELWRLHTGRHSVFELGIGQFVFHGRIILTFITYGIGGGIVILLFTAYVMARRKGLLQIHGWNFPFFTLWAAPAFLFYLLIFIHPVNPGYALVLTPPLYILLAKSVEYLHGELSALIQWRWYQLIATLIIGINLSIFLFSDLPVSSSFIREHDRDLAAMILRLKTFDPHDTALLLNPYVFYGFRHIMYYLPEYCAYGTDSVANDGKNRVFFGGKDRNTIRTNNIDIPVCIQRFATLVIQGPGRIANDKNGISIDVISPECYVASGNITNVVKLYPKLPLRIITGYERRMP